MRTDLGTWRDPQAAAVVRVLERAGLSPDTEQTASGTRITVPTGENDRAHRVLAGSMDDIAQAAASAQPPPGRGRSGTTDPGRATRSDRSRLTTERLRGAVPIVGLVVALLLAASLPAGVARTSVFVLALVAFGVVWARRQDGSDDPR